MKILEQKCKICKQPFSGVFKKTLQKTYPNLAKQQFRYAIRKTFDVKQFRYAIRKRSKRQIYKCAVIILICLMVTRNSKDMYATQKTSKRQWPKIIFVLLLFIFKGTLMIFSSDVEGTTYYARQVPIFLWNVISTI